MLAFFILVAALLIDHKFGEPRTWHPLVIFGRWASFIEAKAFAYINRHPLEAESVQLAGCIAVVAAVAPVVFVVEIVMSAVAGSKLLSVIFAAGLLYLTIGAKSLKQHALAIELPLRQGDLVNARDNLSHIVSRDTLNLNEEQIVKGTIESVLENGSDAIFGAIFWFIIAGAPGAIAYRLINTLDAMWGYRNERYLNFGWGAARLDDLVNYIPARLCALSYALVGDRSAAFRCWRTQSRTWGSPNGGPVIAAGAGALGVELGGDAIYNGEVYHRPVIGTGSPPTVDDIQHALQLVDLALLLWVAVIFALAILGLF